MYHQIYSTLFPILKPSNQKLWAINQNSALLKFSTFNSGRTPLHVAAKFGLIDIYRFLVDKFEQDKNPADNEGRTPKDYIRYGNQELIQLFES